MAFTTTSRSEREVSRGPGTYVQPHWVVGSPENPALSGLSIVKVRVVDSSTAFAVINIDEAGH